MPQDYSFRLRIKKIKNVALCSFCATCLLQLCFGQKPPSVEGASSVLQIADAEQTAFVKSVLDEQFPFTQGDKFSILLINRSELVVPLVESKIEQELRSAARSEPFINLASAMISYAGDEQALRAISKLVHIDETRFAPLIGRTLNCAASGGNPFVIAYLGINDETIAVEIGAWADSALSSSRMQRLWAEALVTRYGNTPANAEWARDPIASRLANRGEGIRNSVLTFVEQVQVGRERQ
jgi:hypothetical protein